MGTEIWKPVVGYPAIEGFAEVSNLGRVRTLDSSRASKRAGQPTQLRRGCVLSPWVGQNGYAYIAIQIQSKRPKYSIHRLVALAFVPGHFAGASVDHIDGDKLHNLPANLQWVTLARNTALQWETGLVDIRGERHPSAKLTDAQVREVRTSDERAPAIAARLGVSDSLIYMIRTGRKRVAA